MALFANLKRNIRTALMVCKLRTPLKLNTKSMSSRTPPINLIAKRLKICTPFIPHGCFSQIFRRTGASYELSREVLKVCNFYIIPFRQNRSLWELENDRTIPIIYQLHSSNTAKEGIKKNPIKVSEKVELLPKNSLHNRNVARLEKLKRTLKIDKAMLSGLVGRSEDSTINERPVKDPTYEEEQILERIKRRLREQKKKYDATKK